MVVLSTLCVLGACRNFKEVIRYGKMFMIVMEDPIKPERLLNVMLMKPKISDISKEGRISNFCHYKKTDKGDVFVKHEDSEWLVNPIAVDYIDVSNLMASFVKELCQSVTILSKEDQSSYKLTTVIQGELDEKITVIGEFDGVRFDPSKTMMFKGASDKTIRYSIGSDLVNSIVWGSVFLGWGFMLA